MNLLLDSHALLWSICASSKLPRTLADRLASPENRVWVSAVSFWEISIKSSLGKLVMTNLTPEEIPAKAQETGYELLPLTPEDAATFNTLPRIEHKDPFDRMLVWQAIRGGHHLVSRDRTLKAYKVQGLQIVWG